MLVERNRRRIFGDAMCLVGVVFASLVALTVPARAGLFKHVEPTAPPDGGWNFVSTTFEAFSIPSIDTITVTARCRYVAMKEPYDWRFDFHNRTKSPVTFRAALIQINNGRFATVPQIYTTVEKTTIRDVSIKPGASSSIEEPGRFGCPGMDGGVNKDKHYVVIVDDVVIGSQTVRSGVFETYDERIVRARRDYANAIGSAMAAGASDGFNSIFGSLPDTYEVPTTSE